MSKEEGLPTAGYLLSNYEGKEVLTQDPESVLGSWNIQDNLVRRKHLQPLWKCPECSTKWMSKPEKACYCPGCGTSLYDPKDPDRNLIDSNGKQVKASE